MKDRGKSIRQTGLITAILFLSAGMCFSIGFSTWVSSYGDSQNISGQIEGDSVLVNQIPTKVFAITSTRVDDFSTTYGFVDNESGKFNSSCCIDGSFTFNFKTAYDSKVISSISTGRFNIAIRLCGSVYDNQEKENVDVNLTLSSYGGVSATSFSLKEDNVSISGLSINYSNYITKQFYIIKSDYDEINELSYDFSLVFTTSNYSKFFEVFSGENAKLKIAIDLEEYNNGE